MKFNLIMVCPPWKHYNRYKTRGPILSDYLPPKLDRAMQAFEFIRDILRDFTTDEHIAAVWVPVNHAIACREYMIGLGYTAGGSFTWLRPNLKKFSERNRMEFLIIFYKGKMSQIADRYLQKADAHFTGMVKRRSAKPDNAYRFLEEEFFLANKLLVYGWTTRPGWTVFHKNL
jgi:N6-adenosine-specific RNA methylase IME4